MPTLWIRAAIKFLPLLCAAVSSAETGPSCETFQNDFVSNTSGLVKECAASSYSEKCFPPDRDHKRPFKALSPGAEYVFICTHGLSDSPYYFKDVSACLLEEGVDVWGIRLEGHVDGNEPERIAEGGWDKWEGRVGCAIEAAIAQGKKPVLCGFSTGGTLALYHALKGQKKIHGLLLFSPAVQLPWLARVLPLGWLNIPTKPATKTYCGRYDQMYTTGVHYLKQGIEKLHALAGHRTEKMDMPTMVYHSTDDQAVLPGATLKFARDRFQNPQFVLMGKKPASDFSDTNLPQEKFSEKLDHSSILKTQGCGQAFEVNPKFDLLCAKIKEFAREINKR